MNFLDQIKEKNQFPILFIGSGITLRYFENAPTWEGLLLQIWQKVHGKNVKSEQNFYAHLNELRLSGKNSFDIYLLVADELEKQVNIAFSRGNLKIEGLDNIQSYKNEISPFRQLIANVFLSLEIKEGIETEIKSFAKMIVKARFIVTTNYDCFIESCFQSRNTKIDVKVGNRGLFESSNSYGELYKIHGTDKEANSICITSEDYNKNESRLALVNAKLLSTLTQSPILFLGYSLTDENIRDLLTIYAENLSDDLSKSVSRIGVVQWKEGEQDIINIPSYESSLGMYYTQILTDNYKEVYEKVSEVDQGYLPSDIVKYEQAFRKIIEVRGPNKGLKPILTEYVNLSNLTEAQLEKRNLVVAFGDEKDFRKPIRDYIEYIRSYFLEDDVPLGMALGFLSSKQRVSTPLPFLRYEKIVDCLEGIPRGISDDIKLLRERSSEYDAFIYVKRIKDKVTVADSALRELGETQSLKEIWDLEEVNNSNKLKYIISKIDEFHLADFDLFVKDAVSNFSNDIINLPDFRKIFMAYSLLANV